MTVYDPTTPDEIWYPIPGLPGYEFSSDLRVRSFHVLGRAPDGSYGGISEKWRLISVYRMTNGYFAFSIRTNGKRGLVYIHRVVAALAYREPIEAAFVLHWDDDKSCNYPSNLRYGDQASNIRDALRNGGIRTGAGHHLAKLDDDAVRAIRAMAAEGSCSIREIGRRFGVSHSLVSNILARKRWAHVS
jgi:hypothetical protein